MSCGCLQLPAPTACWCLSQQESSKKTSHAPVWALGVCHWCVCVSLWKTWLCPRLSQPALELVFCLCLKHSSLSLNRRLFSTFCWNDEDWVMPLGYWEGGHLFQPLDLGEKAAVYSDGNYWNGDCKLLYQCEQCCVTARVHPCRI